MLKYFCLRAIIVVSIIYPCYSQDLVIHRRGLPPLTIGADTFDSLTINPCSRDTLNTEDRCCDFDSVAYYIDYCNQQVHFNALVDSCITNYRIHLYDINGNEVTEFDNQPSFVWDCQCPNGAYIEFVGEAECKSVDSEADMDYAIGHLFVPPKPKAEFEYKIVTECTGKPARLVHYLEYTSLSLGAIKAADGLSWSLHSAFVPMDALSTSDQSISLPSFSSSPSGRILVQPGSYSITLCVYDDFGCNDCTQKTFRVGDDCTVHFTDVKYSFCHPRTDSLVTVTVTNDSRSFGCNTTWLWEWGDGTTSTVKDPVSHAYKIPPGLTSFSRTIKLFMNDPGCDSLLDYPMYDSTINIKSCPFYLNATICSNGRVDVTVSTTGTNIHKVLSWDVPNSMEADYPYCLLWRYISLANNNKFLHRWYPAGGPYTITATVQDDNGNVCDASTTVSFPIPLIWAVKNDISKDEVYSSDSAYRIKLKLSKIMFNYFHAKTKAQHWESGSSPKWHRQPMDNIAVSWTGDYYDSECPGTNTVHNDDSRSREGKARASVWKHISDGNQYWLGTNSVTSTHSANSSYLHVSLGPAHLTIANESSHIRN